MKKSLRFFLGSILSVASLSVIASESIVIELKNGDTYEYFSEEKPKITFGDGEILISTSTAIAQYPNSEFSRFYFMAYEEPEKPDDPDAVVTPDVMEKVNFRFLDKTTVEVSNLPREYPQVQVVDVAGKIIAQFSSQDGRAIVSLLGLPSGIYILHTFNNSIKIAK